MGKVIRIIIAAILGILTISPNDLLPGLPYDDIAYVIGALISLGGMKND